MEERILGNLGETGIGIELVQELPKCDFCKERAVYDTSTKPIGSWHKMCEKHYKELRISPFYAKRY